MKIKYKVNILIVILKVIMTLLIVVTLEGVNSSVSVFVEFGSIDR